MAGANAEMEKQRPLLLRPSVLRLLLMALFAETGYAMLNISTMPVYLKYDRGFGTGVIGLVLVAFLLSEAIFKSPMGALADRFGRKRLIVFGPALSVLTATLTVLVPHGAGASEASCFLVLRMLDGLGAAMLWPAAFALMGDMVEDGERQQSMSLLNMCYLAGVGIALPFGGWANDLIGPHLPELFQRSPGLFFSAFLFACVAITAHLSLPKDHKPRTHEDEHVEGGFKGLLDSIHRIPEYLLLSVVTFMGIGFPMAIIKIFALEQFGMSESKFGALVLPAVGSMALLSVPMAKLGEKWGKARAVHIGMFLCFVGIAFICLGLLIPVFREPWVIAVGGIPVGFGFLLAIPAWMASVSDLDSSRRAASLGAVMTAQGIGAIIGAPLGAWFYERMQPVGQWLKVDTNPGDFGRYTPFAGCAACLLVGWLISLRILHDREPAAAQDADDPQADNTLSESQPEISDGAPQETSSPPAESSRQEEDGTEPLPVPDPMRGDVSVGDLQSEPEVPYQD